MQLSDLIIEKIRRDGPISFQSYMEMALYAPELGYYTSSKETIGPQGDYYTSAVLTPVFGTLIGRQLEEMWHITGKQPFTIVEYGAGTGALCQSILNHLQHSAPVFYQQLHYAIIEKNPFMQEKQDCPTDKVSWHQCIKDIGQFSGCVLSNELIDNFSVHQVVMQKELMEVFVDFDNGFREVLMPADFALKDYLQQLGVTLPDAFRTEINLQAVSWMEEIACWLKRGFLLTIDYGYPSAELYHAYRRNGTLLCYRQHQVNDNPYQHIGEQDITAHVNFSALAYWGLKNDLECCGFTSQGYFLRSLGLLDILRATERDEDPGKIRHLHNLLMDIGSKLQVLIQCKGVPVAQLSGLRLAGAAHLV